MIVVVSDANIMIDLLQADLFLAFLKLDWEKHVSPDVSEEVLEDNSDQLTDAMIAEKIVLPRFSPEDLLVVRKLKARYSSLSLADCSCLYLAEDLSAILLTGERRLRSIATDTHEIEVHGILWVLEQLIEDKIITHRKAHTKLTHLMVINDRLPKRECNRLLRHWKSYFEPLPPREPAVKHFPFNT